MRYIFLSDKFYNDYVNCREIEQKKLRPYILLLLELNGLLYALPLRSHIKHKYAFLTDKINKCGVDYSKALVITDENYIDSKKPFIRNNEHKILLSCVDTIKEEFSSYLTDYKRVVSSGAKRTLSKYRYCTLQYFHKELGLD